jgi:hypothetical protein
MQVVAGDYAARGDHRGDLVGFGFQKVGAEVAPLPRVARLIIGRLPQSGFAWRVP